MKRKMMNKLSGKFRKHLIALTSVLFALLIVNEASSYANDIRIDIESVSVLMNGDVSISYNLAGDDFESVDSIQVYYFPLLDPDLPSEHIATVEPISGQPILLRNDVHNLPSDSQALRFLLWAFAEGDFQARSRIHMSALLHSIEPVSQDGQLAIYATWTNYAVFDPNSQFIEPPEFSYIDLMVFEHQDGLCEMPGTLLRTFENPSLWDQDGIVDFGGRPPGTYCFRMRARNIGGATATSNMRIMNIESIFVPEVEITSVHIDNENNGIIINASTDADHTNISDIIFELYRSTNEFDFGDTPQQSLQGIDLDDPANIRFTDNADIQNGPYFYKIKSVRIDDNRQSDESNVVPSMHLIYESVEIVGSYIELAFSWFTHDFFSDSYSNFQIVYSSGEYQVINFPSGEFEDDIGVEQLGTSFFAFIEATKAGEIIHSNQVHIILEILDKENIPNAFRPDSDKTPNKTFILPFLIDPAQYTINIFDRNGLKVFEYSGDYDPGRRNEMAWNGRIMNTGQRAPGGAYIYEMQYTAHGNAEIQSKKGIVYLVR